jgi:hypothetical protein
VPSGGKAPYFNLAQVETETWLRVNVQAAGQTYVLIWIYGSSTDKTGINTYRRRQPVVPLQFQGIAESNGGSVIDENSMAGCVKNL